MTAPVGVRASRADLGKYPGKTREDIQKILFEREQDEMEKGQLLVSPDYDFRNPGHYRFLLDSSKLSTEEEFDIVMEALRE